VSLPGGGLDTSIFLIQRPFMPTNTLYVSTSASSESQAWEALKTLGDAALAQGGLQAVLQMFVGTLTGAEEVARASEEAGHPETMTPEVIAQWISTDYAPGMHLALAQGAENTPK
jgi:hypothetical protein